MKRSRPGKDGTGRRRSVLSGRACVALVSACLLPGALLLGGQSPPQQPVFRGAANLVLVDAYPQVDGRIVEGLAAEDFEILEDGKPQKIEALEFVRIEPNPAESSRRDPNNVREMVELAADPHNRVFIAFLDSLHTTIEGSHAIRRPLIDTLNLIVGRDDLFGVMTPNMRARDLTLGRRMLSVEEQLTKYWAWGERQRITTDPADPVEDRLRECFHKKIIARNGGIEAVDWMVADGAAARFFDEVLIERRREERTLRSLDDLVAYLPKLREARTVVLTISDGWLLLGPNRDLENEPWKTPRDVRVAEEQRSLPGVTPLYGRQSDFGACLTEMSRLAELDNAKEFRDLIDQSRRTNVSFYPVAASGLAVFDSSMGERLGVNPASTTGTILSREGDRLSGRTSALQTLAENTDGIAIVRTNDLAAGLRRVLDDVSAYYLLGYYSTNQRLDGKYRRIQVSLTRPGIKVHARRGYLAATADSAPSATRPTTGKGAAASSAPVDEALGVLSRIRTTADLFAYGAVGTDGLAIVVEIPSAVVAAGRWAQGGAVSVVATGQNGEPAGSATGRIEAASRGTVVRLPVAADVKGPWRVSVQVKSGNEQIEDRVTIEPAPAGPLLGNPIAYRAAPGLRSSLRPVADFQFHRTERVHVEWPIVKPLDQRQARLLNRVGQPVAVAVTVTERPREGTTQDSAAGAAAQTGLAVDVNLAPLGPGDYVIEVTAGSGGETERRQLAIRVIQ